MLHDSQNGLLLPHLMTTMIHSSSCTEIRHDWTSKNTIFCSKQSCHLVGWFNNVINEKNGRFELYHSITHSDFICYTLNDSKLVYSRFKWSEHLVSLFFTMHAFVRSKHFQLSWYAKPFCSSPKLKPFSVLNSVAPSTIVSSLQGLVYNNSRV